MADEMLDIYDAEMNHLGTASRAQAHKEGLWHQTFHCWVLNRAAEDGPALLLQLRHKNKDTYPDMLDISCAGHLMAGETAREGVRELEEELGLKVSFQELVYCGSAAEESLISDKLIDREFSHVYILECDKPLDQYRCQLSEVSALFLAQVNELEELLEGRRDTIRSEGRIVDMDTSSLPSVVRTICREDLAPHSLEYYRMLFQTLHRLI
ncbi:NUDIX domain-containing protein [Paenibacillus sp. J22TS3]|uniref:NUDIX hydrolase n=1 Tax=Paenibacillus sp. J22TS3 TaxID=2807192 RepID=UPI001B2A39E6|nr:NUDIX domain-containing protein [Paenibacillus sp. J22TS3]GIP24677.1 putative Nudix hydrolase [Paenibacillus sp. J22TS3]